MIWVFFILSYAPAGPPPSTAAVALPPSHIVELSRLDPDGGMLDPACDLLNSTNEREGEEEGGSETNSPRAFFQTTHDLRAVPTGAAIAVANLQVSGLMLGTRAGILRC